MGHLINQELLGTYEDDVMSRSVQGAYQGSMMAPQELALDKKLRMEHQARQELCRKKNALKEELDKVLTKIAVGTRRKVKSETLEQHRKHALDIRIELKELENIRI